MSTGDEVRKTKMNGKALIRKLLASTRLNQTRAYIKFYRMLRGNENISHLLEKTRAERFAKIYETGVWLNDRTTGALSGLGSELERTQSIREQLPKLLAEYSVESILDIGCGDWTWMRHVDMPCTYIGVDIVGSVISSNAKLFGNSRRSFRVLDAVEEALPDCDAILCREVIFHLSFSDSRRLIKNILKSQARYLFTTNDTDVDCNVDIRSGDFRFLNLRKKPYNFPEPVTCIPEDGVSKHRQLGVWRLDMLR